MPGYETLEIRKDGAVDWVTMNRPDRLNAINRKLTDEMSDYFGRLYTDHATRIVRLARRRPRLLRRPRP